MPYKYKPSLYLTSALTIIFTVMVVLSFHTRTKYIQVKSDTIEQMKQNTSKTINLLTKNISNDIESFAVNEYDKTVANQMKSSKHLAIIVKDYYMGEILGNTEYISGKIRDKNLVVDYDQKNNEHNKIIKRAFFYQNKDLVSSDGQVIGNISVYTSDKELQNKLNELIKNSILDFFIIASILIITLFITIYLFIIKPISDISYTLTKQDSHGIPIDRLGSSGPKEIERLARTINFMLESIKKSRLKIEKQNQEIMFERDRFELAVDGTQDGLWDWDIENETISYSNRFYTMLGYDKNDLDNTLPSLKRLVHPKDRETRDAITNSYLKSKGEHKYENTFRMLKKNGSYIWVTSRGKAQFNTEGKPVRFVGFITDITKQVEHNKELDYTAKHDLLTDLPNRFLFNEMIQELLDKTEEFDTHLALLYIDLDGFKEINDNFGHDVGDSILVKSAQKIKNLLRKEDFVARLGGDEFVVAISNLNNKNNILDLLDGFLQALRQNIKNPKDQTDSLPLSASIGATFYPQSKEIGPEALLRQADQAMYDAKKLGKNQYHIFNLDIDSSIKERLSIIQDFEQSLQLDHFVLHYQPKVDMRHNKIIGFEALLRWNHPEKGILYPDQFLPDVNSEKELMLSLGEWVVSTAFEQFSQWKTQGYTFSISINISAHEFKETKTFHLLNSLLEKYPNISPNEIEFEILETHAFDDISQANKMIKTFQELGFQIALDDFGTGYSTLTYLKDLSINTLKIDKSFVMDMLHDRASLSILEATIGLAEAFKCNVIAEGVESVEHGNTLIQLGCYQAQGYVLSKPMPHDEVITWFDSYKGEESWEDNSKKFFYDNSALYAIIEHRQWIKELKNHILDPKEHPIPPELDENRCNFSKWMSNDARKHFSKKVISELDELHIKIHNLAKSAIKANEDERDTYLEAIMQIHESIKNELDSHYTM